MPDEMRRSAFALAAGLAVVVLVAVVALLDSGPPQDARVAVSLTPSPTVAPPTSPAPTPTPSPTPSPTASPAAVLDDRFGFVFTPPFAGDPSSRRDAVRRESDVRPTHDLADGLDSPRRTVPSNYQLAVQYGLAVSPDGRRLAYWTANWTAMLLNQDPQFPRELHVLDLASGARPRTLVTLTQEFGDVAGESVVWSSDGTGLVIGVGNTWFSRGCAADAPCSRPKYSALYLLEAAGGKPREIASIRDNSIVPVAWDRQARLLAAFELEPGEGRVLAYDLIDESGALARTQMVIGTSGTVTVEASNDAKQVLVHEYSSPGQVLHVWPLASPERAVVLSPRGEQILAPARWRPGTAEIGVLFEDRLELWDATGARRPVPLPPSAGGFRPFFFRIDGIAAFVGTYGQTSSYVAIELASGRSAVIPGEDWLSASVRVGP